MSILPFRILPDNNICTVVINPGNTLVTVHAHISKFFITGVYKYPKDF